MRDLESSNVEAAAYLAAMDEMSEERDCPSPEDLEPVPVSEEALAEARALLDQLIDWPVDFSTGTVPPATT